MFMDKLNQAMPQKYHHHLILKYLLTMTLLFSEIMSGQNFSNSSEFDNLTDFAMPNMFFQDVNGTDMDSDIGYQIDLPKDWKGKESKFIMNMVFASPEEINLEDIEEPGTFIILFGLDKEYFVC